ncbi:MAG: cytochrome c [Deltaproteobacteria bacterium]|nr:cytochrome c [Deltaproteobacteria bacterium]MBI5809938.1 cytochrome c [Deltaproteobacteria bacterium]
MGFDIMRKRAYIPLLAAGAFTLTLAVASPSSAASAEENYRFYCAQCHGLAGKGDGPNALPGNPVSPRDHTNAVEMGRLTDEDIISVIRDGGAAAGKSTLMPPFSRTLAKSEITALKDYLRRLCKCRGPQAAPLR